MRKNIGYIDIIKESNLKGALSSRCSLLKSFFVGIKLGPWSETKKDIDKCWNEMILIIKQLKHKI